MTLTNVGGATLTINSIAVSGGNAGDFAQNNNCGTSLAPGAFCTIKVTFTPTTTGPRSFDGHYLLTMLRVPHTRIALTGTGTGFAVTPACCSADSTMTQQFTAGGA